MLESLKPDGPTVWWTKTWGRPNEPTTAALLFNSKGHRDKALERSATGDLVIHAISDNENANPQLRRKVGSIVELTGEAVLSSDLGIDRPPVARREDFNKDGRFRWPYGIGVSRVWHIEPGGGSVNTDYLIPEHSDPDKVRQGAVTIQEVAPASYSRLSKLRLREVIDSGSVGNPIELDHLLRSHRRTVSPKGSERSGSTPQHGQHVYVAVLVTAQQEMIFKVGSGQFQDRIKTLNWGRVPDVDPLWEPCLDMIHDVGSPEAAHELEMQILDSLRRELNHCVPERQEMVKNVSFREVREAYNEVVFPRKRAA